MIMYMHLHVLPRWPSNWCHFCAVLNMLQYGVLRHEVKHKTSSPLRDICRGPCHNLHAVRSGVRQRHAGKCIYLAPVSAAAEHARASDEFTDTTEKDQEERKWLHCTPVWRWRQHDCIHECRPKPRCAASHGRHRLCVFSDRVIMAKCDGMCAAPDLQHDGPVHSHAFSPGMSEFGQLAIGGFACKRSRHILLAGRKISLYAVHKLFCNR